MTSTKKVGRGWTRMSLASLASLAESMSLSMNSRWRWWNDSSRFAATRMAGIGGTRFVLHPCSHAMPCTHINARCRTSVYGSTVPDSKPLPTLHSMVSHRPSRAPYNLMPKAALPHKILCVRPFLQSRFCLPLAALGLRHQPCILTASQIVGILRCYLSFFYQPSLRKGKEWR